MSMPKREEEAALCGALRVVLQRDANLGAGAHLLCSKTRRICRLVCSSLRKDVEAYTQRLRLPFEACPSLHTVDLSLCASLVVLPEFDSCCDVVLDDDALGNVCWEEDEGEDGDEDGDEDEDEDGDEDED
eukprot:gene1746-biopygen14572